MKKNLILLCCCFLISCVSISTEENCLYGPATSLEKMNSALKNLRFDTMTHPDFFTSPDFIGKIETQWETYYLPGERLMNFLTGEALDKEVQVKYFITLYHNFYELKGVYQIIARDWANPLDKNYTKKEIPLERDSEYWSLIENFAASLQKELVKN